MQNFAELGKVLPTFLVWIVVFLAMWLFMFRPQQKRRQKEEEMRNNLKIGDEIVTIGGVVGKVIGLRDDSFVLETGGEKLCFKKWAISSVNKQNG